MAKNVFEFIKTEENAYDALPVAVVDNYEWSMPEHIKTTVLYKNNQFLTGKADDKPFKNIILPILRLHYRAEGFDVKDIKLFVNNTDDYYKSFLIEKFHEKWARDNKIDTFIDEMVETYVDFGGVLVKDVNQERPEVVKWQTIAFCDQTDILSGPIAIKHFYSPDQLKAMEKQGWGNTANGATISIDELITLSQNSKEPDVSKGKKTQTPGKYIKIYELHGTFPEWWLEKPNDEPNAPPDDKDPETKYVGQIHIIGFYKKENGDKQFVTLFKGKEKELPFKLKLRDPIHGRALGLGAAEELFEPQVWTNKNMIYIQQMLEAASKIILKSTDPSIAAKHPNGLKDLDNLEIIDLAENTELAQVDTRPINLEAFSSAVQAWEVHAKEVGSATGAVAGDQNRDHRAFNTVALIIQQGLAIHDYRKGQLATFLDEIYKDWVIPYIAKEITKGQEFLSELSLDELQSIAENLVTCQVNDFIKEKILNGEVIDDQAVEQMKQQVRDQFMKGGNKRFIKILEGELASAPIDVEVSIANKQKDLPAVVEQLTKIFQQVIANPDILNDPRLAKIFNQILENSGFSPIDFYSKPAPQQNQQNANRVSESISFKDLPPDGKVQMAAQAGIKIAPAPPSAAPQPVAQKVAAK
jgi:hypothetical protein